MIALDITSLSLVNGLLVLVCGVAFLLETVIKRSDEVGRLWSLFFIGLMFALFAYVVGSLQADAWWAFPAGNGAFVAALGLLWSGARRANRRRGLFAIPVAGALIVGGSGLLDRPDDVYWTGALQLFLGVALFSALSSIELSRGSLRRLPSARLLSLALGGMTVYNGSRAVVFATLGTEHPVFTSVYGAEASTLIETCLTVLGAITLSSIQADRFRKSAGVDAEFGTRVTIDGILPADTFRQVAESWLMRAIRERTTLVLLLVDLADLAEVNVAFGRAAGDAAIRLTGRIALTQAPTASIVGHLTARRFALLMELPASDSVAAIADRIADAVLSTPIDEQDRFRASTFCGSATTRTSGARFDDLLRAAADSVAMDADRARRIAEQLGSSGA